MSDRSRKKRPRDVSQFAKQVVEEATSEEPIEESEETPRTQAARKGGQKGGKARAEKLTAEERTKIAKKAAEARWRKS